MRCIGAKMRACVFRAVRWRNRRGDGDEEEGKQRGDPDKRLWSQCPDWVGCGGEMGGVVALARTPSRSEGVLQQTWGNKGWERGNKESGGKGCSDRIGTTTHLHPTEAGPGQAKRARARPMVASCKWIFFTRDAFARKGVHMRHSVLGRVSSQPPSLPWAD